MAQNIEAREFDYFLHAFCASLRSVIELVRQDCYARNRSPEVAWRGWYDDYRLKVLSPNASVEYIWEHRNSYFHRGQQARAVYDAIEIPYFDHETGEVEDIQRIPLRIFADSDLIVMDVCAKALHATADFAAEFGEFSGIWARNLPSQILQDQPARLKLRPR